MTYHIFIGYDSRQPDTFRVAKHSLLKHATVPIVVHKLEHKELRDRGLFWREWLINAEGQYIDQVDGKPFSTEFSHTRFLVPTLWRELDDPNKSDLVMFVDSDFLWLEDIGPMFKEIERLRTIRNRAHPVYCTQHNYKPEKGVKMDGVNQAEYNRKLWSALMVWDMSHQDNDVLIPEFVNMESGRNLHQFNWLSDPNRIEDIPEKYHFLPGHSEKNTSEIVAIHYTEGAPNFPKYRNCRYANLWKEAYGECLGSKISTVVFNVGSLLDGD